MGLRENALLLAGYSMALQKELPDPIRQAIEEILWEDAPKAEDRVVTALQAAPTSDTKYADACYRSLQKDKQSVPLGALIEEVNNPDSLAEITKDLTDIELPARPGDGPTRKGGDVDRTSSSLPATQASEPPPKLTDEEKKKRKADYMRDYWRRRKLSDGPQPAPPDADGKRKIGDIIKGNAIARETAALLPIPPDRLIERHNTYAGKRDDKTLTPEDWGDIKNRFTVRSESIKTLSSDYDVEPEKMQEFIDDQRRKERSDREKKSLPGEASTR